MIFSLLYFVYSLVILDSYNQGDRFVYAQVYQAISGLSFIGALVEYFWQLGATDIGWLLVYFPFSKITNNLNIAQSIISTLLFWHAGKFFYVRCNNIKFFIFYLNCYLNIQFLALSFSSLRLAIAFLFVFMAANSKRFKSFFFALISIISHITILLVMYLNREKRYKLFLQLIMIVCGLAVLFIFWNVIGVFVLGKLNTYINSGISKLNIFGLFKLAILLLFLILGASEKRIFYIIPIIVIYLLIPDARIYQLIYFTVYLRLTCVRSQYSTVALIVLSFLGIPNGLKYIIGIFERGNGLDPLNF